MRRIYLDWNATAPPLAAVVDAMSDSARFTWGNPSSVHGVGRAARAVVEDAREAVASLSRCDPRDVVLTSGATEANNLALRSAFAAAPGALLTSRLEHPSITRVAESLACEGRARVRWIRVCPEGTIDLDDLESAVRGERRGLVAVQAVNSETGVIQPIAEVLAVARRAGLRVHVDAAQAFGRIDELAVEADSRSLAGHKIRGPKSTGALVARPDVPLSPVLVGGNQERGVRPGTVDPVGAAGLAVAARHALASPPRWRALAPLRDALEAAVLRACTGATVHGAAADRAPHVTSIAFPGWAGPELVAALDLEGVAVSSGSACSAGTAEPSAVLVAMGADARAASAVRFSLGEETTANDIQLALDALGRVLERGR